MKIFKTLATTIACALAFTMASTPCLSQNALKKGNFCEHFKERLREGFHIKIDYELISIRDPNDVIEKTLDLQMKFVRPDALASIDCHTPTRTGTEYIQWDLNLIGEVNIPDFRGLGGLIGYFGKRKSTDLEHFSFRFAHPELVEKEIWRQNGVQAYSRDIELNGIHTYRVYGPYYEAKKTFSKFSGSGFVDGRKYWIYARRVGHKGIIRAQ